MKFKSIALSLTLATSIISFASHAEITVKNNSNGTFTGSTTSMFSPCSSRAGSAGVLSKGQQVTVPKFVMDTFCNPNCEVKGYASNNCSGPAFAVVKVDHTKGIVAINNYKNPNGYYVTGQGQNVEVRGGSNSWFDFFSKLVG
ncbi:MAG: hypothetical protein ACD_46C00052G0001 [uncultured bacterium]|nr:MAG: hypothetical protein ACD_46C00052G0001 [uncultured bacterium]